LPWIVLGIVFPANPANPANLANLAIRLIVFWSTRGTAGCGEVTAGIRFSGSSFCIFIYTLIVAIQVINVTFPFALGDGATRRGCFLGIALNFAVLSLIYSTALPVLSIIEELTNGWGLGGRMFTAVYFGHTWPVRFFINFVGLLFFFFMGALFASVYVRWKAYGLVALLSASVVSASLH
jgi:hypothetical protein